MNLVITTVIILLNLIIYFFWIFLSRGGVESSLMVQHFLVSWDSLWEGRFWTLVTSAFSHNMFWHLFLNMYVLNSFGPIIEQTLGSKRFLQFYVLAGIVSSFSHAAVSAFLMDRPDLPALGASGALSGVILLFSMLYPRQRVLFLGFFPVPAALGAVVLVGLDLWGLMIQATGGGLPIGHGAHLGGALTGILYFLFVLKPRESVRTEFF
jgi:membrane associated rhomboid family serine protease